MLAECFRVLKPGGTIRVATPDLAAILRLHTTDPSAVQRRYLAWSTQTQRTGSATPNACHVINHFFYSWGHRFIYDRETLGAALEAAGFADLRSYQSGQSDDPNLRGIESHGKYIPQEMNLYETMVLEARRPG
jgi:predicted SAM-dependent methyltransferase